MLRNLRTVGIAEDKDSQRRPPIRVALSPKMMMQAADHLAAALPASARVGIVLNSEEVWQVVAGRGQLEVDRRRVI